jgi:hypothetical protein
MNATSMSACTRLAVLLLCLSFNAAASNVTQRCPSYDSGSDRLRIIYPPHFSAITLPVMIIACVPQHLLLRETTDHKNVSLLLTVNTLVVSETGILPEVTFYIDKNFSENLHVGMVAYPSLEFCVYVVAVDAASSPVFGSAYSCIITSASSHFPACFVTAISIHSLPNSITGSSRDSVIDEQSRLMYVHQLFTATVPCLAINMF